MRSLHLLIICSLFFQLISPVALQAAPLPQTWQAPIGYNPVSNPALPLPFATETQSFNPFQDPFPTLDPSTTAADPFADIPEFVWSRPAPTTGQGMAGGWEVNTSTPVHAFPSTPVTTTTKQTGDLSTKPHSLLYLPLQDRQETASVALLPGEPGDLKNKSASVAIQFSNEAVSAPATAIYRSATRPEILTASMGVGGPAFTLEVQDHTSRQALTTFAPDVETSRDAASRITPRLVITLQYTDRDVEGLDERTLFLYHRTGSEMPWHRVASYAEPDQNRVIAHPQQMGEFVLLGQHLDSSDTVRLVLDPDDDDGFAVWPAPIGRISELPYNVQLATALETKLENECDIEVLLTRSDDTRFVDRTLRANTALGFDAQMFTTLAFNSFNQGVPWGIPSDGGSEGWVRPEVPADEALVTELINQVSIFTTRPTRLPTESTIYAEFAALPPEMTYGHLETLFLNHFYDFPVINEHFDQIVDGTYTALRMRLEAEAGLDCGSSPYPTPPSAEDIQRLRDLGRHYYERYGADPVSFSTGNYILELPLFTLEAPGTLDVIGQLTYNSQDGRDDLFGYGWAFPYTARAQRYSDESVSIALHDGRTYHYTASGTGYTAPAGVFDTLSATDTGWEWTAHNGTVLTFVGRDDGRGVLTEWRDRNDNTLAFEYSDLTTPLPRLSEIRTGSGQAITVSTDTDGHITALTLPDGRTWGFTYKSGDLTTITDARGGQRQFVYDARHRITDHTDPEGIDYLINRYDDRDRVIEQVDASGHLTSLSYDTTTGITLYTDNLGNLTRYEFDDLRRVTAMEDALGYRERYIYDDQYHITEMVDARGNRWVYSYDDHGNVLSETDPLGHVVSYTYNSANDRLSRTDEGGTNGATRTTEWVYDTKGNLLETRQSDGTTVSATYTASGDRLSLTNPNGHTTTFAYDARGNLSTETDALGQIATYEHDLTGRLLAFTDANGHRVGLVYDAGDNTTSLTDPFGAVTTFEYDRNDLLMRMVDRRGGITRYTYDENLKLLSETTPEGNTTSHTYDAMYNRVTTTDPRGNTTSLGYDPTYRLSTVEDALGAITEFRYDANDNLLEREDALGGIWTFIYDERNLLTRETDPLGGSTVYTLDAVGRVVSETNPRGAVTTVTYDLLDRPLTITDALGGIQTLAYDATGNRLGFTDQNGQTRSSVYDALNRVIEARDATGNLTTMSYDAVGNILTITDALNRLTQMTYDANDNLLTVEDALGGITRMTYDPEEQQLTLTNANGHTTGFTYDLDGRQTIITEAGGQVTRLSYDAASNLITVRNAKGNEWHYTYDALNRRESEQDPLGYQVQFAYDTVGNRTLVTDQNNVPTRYDYDALYRLTGVVQNYQPSLPANYETNVRTGYGYDATGNLIRITDPNGYATTFGYDLLNRRTEEMNPLGHRWEYAYDGVGNLFRRTDAEGQVTLYGYDPNNLLLTETYPDGSAVQHEYDAVYNETARIDSLGRTTKVYDELNRLERSTNHLNQTVAYTFDGVGNRLSLTFSDGKVARWDYDSTNYLTGMTDPAGNRFTFTRDTTHNLTEALNPNGTKATYAFDSAERLTGVANRKTTNATLASFVYTLDGAGNRTQTVATYATGRPTTLTTQYDYDPLNRMVAWQDSAAHFAVYTFDAAGNRVRQTTNYDPTRSRSIEVMTTDYSYDAANQLTGTLTTTALRRTDLNQGNDSFAVSYAYDRNGNRVSRTMPDASTGSTRDRLRTDYEYDFEQRLVHHLDSRDPGNGRWQVKDETRLAYDGYGRLFRRTHDQHAGGGGQKWTEYVYDGLDPIAEYVSNGVGYVNYHRAEGRILSAYNGPGGGNGKTYYYHYDGLNSVAMMTKHNGGNSAHDYRYADYGMVLDNNGHAADASNFTNPHNRITYTGQTWDENMELFHFHAREYDPAVGVWLQQDPYRGELTAPQSLHRYAYVQGNPVTYIDWYGYASSNMCGVTMSCPMNPASGCGVIRSCSASSYLEAQKAQNHTSPQNGMARYPNQEETFITFEDGMNELSEYHSFWSAYADSPKFRRFMNSVVKYRLGIRGARKVWSIAPTGGADWVSVTLKELEVYASYYGEGGSNYDKRGDIARINEDLALSAGIAVTTDITADTAGGAGGAVGATACSYTLVGIPICGFIGYVAVNLITSTGTEAILDESKNRMLDEKYGK